MSYEYFLQAKDLYLKQIDNPNDLTKMFDSVFAFSHSEKNVLYLICDNPLECFKLNKFFANELSKVLKKVGINIAFKFIDKPIIDEEPIYKPQIQEIVFKSEYSFDNFVIGENNEFAYENAKKCARGEAMGTLLYIYGGAGLGKTHLLMAIGNYMNHYNKNKQIFYFSSLTFITEYFNASKKGDFDSFKQKYYNSYDVILVDDIQLLEARKKSEEEFFQLFEYYSANKMNIIVTSDKIGKDLDLHTRLKSRLGWGISTLIEKPNLILRKNILKSKINLYYKDVIKNDEFVINEIAPYIDSNVRELEGALHSVISYITTFNLPLSKENIALGLEQVLSKNQINMKKSSFFFDLLKEKICQYFKISLDDLMSDSRNNEFAYPRQLYSYILRKHFKSQIIEISNSLNKNHSTIIYYNKNINEKIKKNKNIKDDYNELIKLVS